MLVSLLIVSVIANVVAWVWIWWTWRLARRLLASGESVTMGGHGLGIDPPRMVVPFDAEPVFEHEEAIVQLPTTVQPWGVVPRGEP